MRGLQGTSETTKLVVSISLLAAFLELGRWIWPETSSHPVDRFFEGNTISVLGVNVTWHEGIALVLAVVVAIGLRLLLYRTRAGIAMRASVDDRPLAALHGAKPDRSAMLAWAIGCSLAALAGILTAPLLTLSHTVLTLLIVNAYAAAMIGRLRSLPADVRRRAHPRSGRRLCHRLHPHRQRVLLPVPGRRAGDHPVHRAVGPEGLAGSRPTSRCAPGRSSPGRPTAARSSERRSWSRSRS